MEAGSLAQRQPGQTADQVADQFNTGPVEGSMTYESFQDQSNVFSRIGELASVGIQGIKNQYENVRNNLNRAAALGGIAVAGVGFAYAAESVATDVAMAQDPQATTTSNTLGPNALKKLCKSQILKAPLVGVQTDLKEPNILINRGLPDQEWFLSEQYPLVSQECNGKFRRIGEVRPQVQDPNNHKRWHDSAPKKWTVSIRTNLGFGDPSDANYTETSTSAQDLYSRKSGLYKCSPRGVTKARFIARNSVMDVKKGKIIARKSHKFPVNIFAGTDC